MQKYNEYKNTTEKWIPKIPVHWDFVNVKSLFEERKEKNTPLKTDFILSLTAKQGVIPYSEKKSGGNKAKDDISKYNIAHKNDLLVNCMNVVSGSSGVSNYYGAISPVYYALYTRSQKTNIRYYEYLFRNSLFYTSLVGLGNGLMMKVSSTGKLNTVRKRIPMNKLNKVMLPYPPSEEQDQIVRFLDWKITEMNHFIHEKKKEIRLLEELKKAMICKFALEGLTKDTKFYKSDYPWINKVPIGWKETRLKNVLKKLNRIAHPEDELLVCSNSGKVIFRGDSRLGLVASSDDIYQGVRKGDLLIHGMDTWHGAIAVSNYDGKCTPVVHVCDSNENKRYIAYYLQALAYKKVYKAISNGVRENTSDFRSWNKAGSINILIPPTEEQNAISNLLDKKCNEIEDMIEGLRMEISYVTELRTKTIADVITGKVDVRNVVIPEYEEIKEVEIDEDIEDDIEDSIDEDSEE